MTRPGDNDDGDPSPLSSPLASPELVSKRANPVSKREGTESPLEQASDDSDSSRMKLSLDTSSSDYDHMARSQLFEHERGLGPSGLRRIRQQPSPRLTSIPNTSTSSSFVAPPLSRSSTTPQSGVSSRAASTCLPEPTSPALEDLHRFPSESLHSFSFSKQSEELLQNRQNILKRSIDFMKDRLGWTPNTSGVTNVQARVSGDTEVQSMMDMLARSSILEKDEEQGQAVLSPGPITGPAETNGENTFDKAFTEQLPESRNNLYNSTDFEGADPGRFLSPIVDDQPLLYQRRDLKSAPTSRRASLKRTFTDLSTVSIRSGLTEGLGQQYSIPDSVANQLLSPNGMSTITGGPSVHSHSSKGAPVVQAVFRTESESPWTILAANDLACLIFGVTQGEVRKLSILEVVQKDRREWLESKLKAPDTQPKSQSQPEVSRPGATNTKSMMMGKGVTAQLLSKPPSRQKPIRRAQTEDGYGGQSKHAKNSKHPSTKSRGVLLCGDVVPILKRNGATGSASLWVMEKRGGLIWVLEEITEDVAYLRFDESGRVKEAQGDIEQIWGPGAVKAGSSITTLLPHIPTELATNSKDSIFSKIAELKYFTAKSSSGMKIPATVTQVSGPRDLRVSCFPHVAGMMVLSSSSLNIISANSVFACALFGLEPPEGSHVTDLVPGFDEFLNILTEEDNLPLVDGIVIPEQSFRRAKAISVLRDGTVDAASVFLQPTGLPAKHRDGSYITVDVQMRIVKSETFFTENNGNPLREVDESGSGDGEAVGITEVVYALWITYSRQLHSADRTGPQPSGKLLSASATPSPKPSPGQPSSSPHAESDSLAAGPPTEAKPKLSLLTEQLNKDASEAVASKPARSSVNSMAKPKREEIIRSKKTINEYVILEEMGQGAYGQVKLARSKADSTKKVVLKYVTKRRILVDTWTRDRRLGTVPLEIHVLDFLRRDELWHPNIVEMEGFFEDDVNYYIEMVPHGLPGMDLFDYIELRTNMNEAECRNIFRQVVDAIHHLHTKALVVHRDIKDENVILNGEGKIKLIDFGSASYIKNGPFDVFVGTIDYAAPEVLQGKSYRGKEQDVWALGILLYTIVYKENPFYNIDEILDHPLRVPFIPFSEDCIDLIRKMLDRDVDERLTITEVIEHTWMTAT